MNIKLKLFLTLLITNIFIQTTHSNFFSKHLGPKGLAKLSLTTKAKSVKQTIHTKAIVNYTSLNCYAAKNPILASLLISGVASVGLNYLIEDYKTKNANRKQPYGLPLKTFCQLPDDQFDRV